MISYIAELDWEKKHIMEKKMSLSILKTRYARMRIKKLATIKCGPVACPPLDKALEFDWVCFPIQVLLATIPCDQWQVSSRVGISQGARKLAQTPCGKFKKNQEIGKVSTLQVYYIFMKHFVKSILYLN